MDSLTYLGPGPTSGPLGKWNNGGTEEKVSAHGSLTLFPQRCKKAQGKVTKEKLCHYCGKNHRQTLSLKGLWHCVMKRIGWAIRAKARRDGCEVGFFGGRTGKWRIDRKTTLSLEVVSWEMCFAVTGLDSRRISMRSTRRVRQ